MITKTKIESKIKSYINSILDKETIDYNDFKALNEYLAKIKVDESAKKYKENQKERNEVWQALTRLMASNIDDDSASFLCESVYDTL